MNICLKQTLVLATLALSSLGQALAAPTFYADNCWIRLMPGNLPSAAYLTLHNQGASPETVDEIVADGFGMAMMHETQNMGSASRMVMLDSVVVPPKSIVSFAPGGKHVMLEQRRADSKVGGHIQLSVQTAQNRRTSVSCTLKSPATE